MVAPLAEHQDQLVALCQRYGVRRLEVIGSVARGEANPRDVDLLVEFAERSENAFNRYFDFKDDLEALLGKPVDLISTRAIENPALLRNIAPDRTVVYGQ